MRMGALLLTLAHGELRRKQESGPIDDGRDSMKGSAALKKEAKDESCWRGFRPGDWSTSINVRDFIVRNVTPYAGDEKFLAGPSKRTKAVWAKLQPYFQEERKKGVLAV